MKQTCEEIELRYVWTKFLKIGADKDYVHSLIRSSPNYSIAKIIITTKDIKNKDLKEVTSNVYGNGHTSLFANVIDDIENGRQPYVDAVAVRNALEVVLSERRKISKAFFEKLYGSRYER